MTIAVNRNLSNCKIARKKGKIHHDLTSLMFDLFFFATRMKESAESRKTTINFSSSNLFMFGPRNISYYSIGTENCKVTYSIYRMDLMFRALPNYFIFNV